MIPILDESIVAFVSELLKQLEIRRQSLIREHELNLSAIDRLVALERAQISGSSEAASERNPVEGHFVRRGRRRGISPESLAGQILSVMEDAPNNPWSSAQVYAVIKRKGGANGLYALPEDDLKARNAISSVMGQLHNTGRIFQVSPSKGAIPAFYRAIETTEIEKGSDVA